MTEDERAIRKLIEAWISASEAGDVDTVLALMAEDVVFMVPGRDPFGKKQFEEASRVMKNVRMSAASEILEVSVEGSWAFCRTRLRVTMTPPEGNPVRRSGHTLSILRKKTDGAWVIARDANLLAPE